MARSTMMSVLMVIALPGMTPAVDQGPPPQVVEVELPNPHDERPRDLPAPRPATPPAGVIPHVGPWSLGPYQSFQVNVDGSGANIMGDAANEPSMAIDPTNPDRIAIGWRQFDSVLSNFRQAGVGFSADGGLNWTFPGVLDPGVFRSDPVLDADADGLFYYYSLTVDGSLFTCDMYTSLDGGAAWGSPVPAHGGDKAWFTIDRTAGIGQGNIYAAWSPFASCCPGLFTRSTNGGASYLTPVAIPTSPRFGTVAVGPDGAVYVAGTLNSPFNQFRVAKSTNAQNSAVTPTFDFAATVNLDGSLGINEAAGPNPGGLLGQVWIAADHSGGPTHNNLYVLCSVERASVSDPLDVMFTRSTNGGTTWSPPLRVNDDPLGNNAYQWFGTLSVAPTGRIDAFWNDTRNNPANATSELYYSYSLDAGVTWQPSRPVSPAFNHSLGYPQQNKLGDYYHSISDAVGSGIAYAATFNGEQDVYFLRVSLPDCNGNSVPDELDISAGTSDDSDGSGVPDECETPVPTLSQWGGLQLTLALLIAGSILWGRTTRTAVSPVRR